MPKKSHDLPVAYHPLEKAAAAAGVSQATLYRAEAEGKLTFVRLGGRTLVTADSLKRYIGSAKPWVRSSRADAAQAARRSGRTIG